MKLYISQTKNIFYIFYSYDKAIQLKPNHWVWSSKANLLKELHRYDEAIKWLLKKYIFILVYFFKL